MKYQKFLPLLFLCLISCGYKDVSEKNYRLYVDTDDSRLQNVIRWLVDDLNSGVGFEMLTISKDESSANSRVEFVDSGSEFSGNVGEVGWGQWKKSTTYEPEIVRFGLQTPERIATYSMEVKFDMNYFMSRVESSKSIDLYELKKLFLHEIGHGLGCPHDDENDSSIMYPNVSKSLSSKEDFQKHYEKMVKYYKAF